jgi:phosphomannomutase
MTRRYFGTDGIRGTANKSPMTPEIAMKVGMAAGVAFQRGKHRHRVVIGKDTRLSGYMIENALVAGFTAAGLDVLALGPMPTPAVSRLTHSMRADLGVMISASHNPHHDNGIKFFGPDGYKLSDAVETEIEALLSNGAVHVDAEEIGRVTRLNESYNRYVEYVKTTLSDRVRLTGLKVVVDCANGAAYRAAPELLWEMGAEVIPVGVNPNGFNINSGCGSTDTARAAQTVRDSPRRYRHLSRWRCRPDADRARRKGHRGRWRPAPGAAGHPVGAGRIAAQAQHAGRDGDVEPWSRAPSESGQGLRWQAHAGGRPLRGRARCAPGATTSAANNPGTS